MPPISTPNRARRFSQATTRRSRKTAWGSKLASTNTDLASAADARSPSTAIMRPLLARTGSPSTDTWVHANSDCWASQLPMNSGSVAAANPKLENSGNSRKASFRMRLRSEFDTMMTLFRRHGQRMPRSLIGRKAEDDHDQCRSRVERRGPGSRVYIAGAFFLRHAGVRARKGQDFPEVLALGGARQ